MNQWKHFSGTNISARPSQGVSKFSDGLPAPFKDGVLFLMVNLITSCLYIGIEKCRWPGRHQVVYRDHMTYYLDGAHTIKSIKASSNWFKSAVNEQTAKLR